jgi:hypothetical protein
VDRSTTLRDLLRGGLFGALAATAFSGALAGALVSSAPSISPALSSARTATAHSVPAPNNPPWHPVTFSAHSAAGGRYAER